MQEVPTGAPAPANETPEQRDIRLNKDVAAFSYVWIMSVIVFASRRDSPFIQYHAKQASILFLISIPVAMIPFFGRYLVFIVLAGMLLGFINAANGRREELPVVGKLATGELKPKDIWSQALPYFHKMLQTLRQIFKRPAAEKKDAPASSPASASAAAPTPTSPAQPAQTPPPSSLDNSPPKP